MPGYEGYIYKNNSIDENNFKMNVTVLAVGQGSANMIEIFDGDKLVYLACIDFGTNSSEKYIDILYDDNCAAGILYCAMCKRVEDAGAAFQAKYFAYMDMLFLTHQDNDHQCKLKPFIEIINDASPARKKKYIGELYLGGWDYMKGISTQLAAGGVIYNAVEKIYHITQDNTADGSRFYPTGDAWGGESNAKAVVTMNWIMSCLIGNQTFHVKGTFPSPSVRKDRINFQNANKKDTAETKNESSTLLHLSVFLPSRAEGKRRVSFIFPGDAQKTTFEAFNELEYVPPTGKVMLMLMPHHGSEVTAKGSTRGGKKGFEDLDDFIDRLRNEKEIGLAIASSEVAAGLLGHPSGTVCGYFYKYCDISGQGGVLAYHKESSFKVYTREVIRAVNTTEYVMEPDESAIMDILDHCPGPADKVTGFKLRRRHFRVVVDGNGGDEYQTLEFTSGLMSTPVGKPPKTKP